MSVVIRLTTTGKTHNISFRIVVAEKWSKRDGKFIENLGFYNPLAPKGENYKIDSKRYEYWISKGAKPSPAVIEIVTTDGVRPPRVSKRKAKAKTTDISPKETKADASIDKSPNVEPTALENTTEETQAIENEHPVSVEEKPEDEKDKD